MSTSSYDPNWSQHLTLKSGQQVTARFIRESDVQLLLDFINPILEEKPYLLVSEKQTLKSEQEFIIKALKEMMDGEAVYVIVEDRGKIIANSRVIKGKLKHSHIGSLGITISKEYRGHGLGKQLMMLMEQLAKQYLGAKMLNLTCFAKNTPALELYHKVGYQEYGRLADGYFHEGKYEDEVLLQKKI